MGNPTHDHTARGKRRFLVKTRGKLYSPTAELPQNVQVAGIAFGTNQTFLREEEHDPIVIEQILANPNLEVTLADTAGNPIGAAIERDRAAESTAAPLRNPTKGTVDDGRPLWSGEGKTS